MDRLLPPDSIASVKEHQIADRVRRYILTFVCVWCVIFQSHAEALSLRAVKTADFSQCLAEASSLRAVKNVDIQNIKNTVDTSIDIRFQDNPS